MAVRLGEGNDSVLDYLLLPTSEMAGSKIRFMEAGLRRFDGRRFQSYGRLTQAILHQVVRRANRKTRDQCWICFCSQVKPVGTSATKKALQKKDRPRAALIDLKYR